MLNLILKHKSEVLREFSIESFQEWESTQTYLSAFLAGYLSAKLDQASPLGSTESDSNESIKPHVNMPPAEKPEVPRSEVVILDEAATGKRTVARFGRQRITGNMLAALEVISELGRPLSSPAQLVSRLKKHERFDLDVRPTTARNQLRTLREAGLLSNDLQLTAAGEYITEHLQGLYPPQKSPEAAPAI